VGVVDFWWLGFDGYRDPRSGILASSHTTLSMRGLSEEDKALIMRRIHQDALEMKAEGTQRYERPWWFVLERERGSSYIQLSLDADHDGAPELEQRVVLQWLPRPSSWVRRCARREGLADG
jgi:hypothetical protein